MATIAQLINRRKRAEARTNQIIRTTVSPSTASSLGTTTANIENRQAGRRQKLLRELMNAGRLDPATLGPHDRQLVGGAWLKQFTQATPPGQDSGGEFLGLVGGDVGTGLNNLFKGAYEFGTHLLPGLYTAGKAVVNTVPHIPDIAEHTVTGSAGSLVDAVGKHPELLNPVTIAPYTMGATAYGAAKGLEESGSKTPVAKEIIDPTIQYYRQKYSGSPGEIAHKALVEDPFGTLLDVGTIASAGSAAAGRAGGVLAKVGAAAADAGEGTVVGRLGASAEGAGRYLSKFGTAGTRGTRPPLVVGKNIEIPREYGRSPLVRTGQRFADKYLHRIPTIGEKLAGWRAHFAQAQDINTVAGRTKILSGFEYARHSKPVTDALKRLTDDEALALTLLKNGVNDQPVRAAGGVTRGMLSAVDSYAQYIQASLEHRLPQGLNITEMPNLDPARVEAFLAKLQSPEVRELITNPTQGMIRASDVWDEAVQRSLEQFDISAAEHEQRVWAPQQALRVPPRRLGEYEHAAKIEAVRDPRGAFERFAQNQEMPIEPNYIPHSIAEGTYAGDLASVARRPPVEQVAFAENLAAKAHPRFLTETDLKAFLSGGMRVDKGIFTDFIKQREGALAQNGMIDQLVSRLGEHDANGDLVTAMNRGEMEQKGFSQETHELVPVDGLIRFHRAETNILRVLHDALQSRLQNVPEDAHANLESLGGSIEKYLEDESNAVIHEELAAAHAPQVVMTKDAAKHLMETFDSMKPAGTKFGRGYDRLMNIWRTGTLALMPRWWINTFAGSALLTILSGAIRPRYFAAAWRYGGKSERATRFLEKFPELRPGIYGSELHEAESLSGRRHLGITRKIFTGVENMEGFFKRVGFFHQLDKEAKYHMRQMSEVLDGYSHWGRLGDEYLSNLMDNHPDIVNGALHEQNRFFYNYTSLGPIERRWVRRFVPFWGWYKFVTKLVYQLPFQYPGRTLVLNQLSQIASDFEDNELGILPPDIQGAIFLNKNRLNEKYVPTFGINPFADFANPAAPEGALAGMLAPTQLGPVFQSFLSAAGLDPWRGQATDFSPISNLVMGRYGNVVNPQTGEEVPYGLGGAFSLQRLIGGFARSIPQVRNLEILSTGGRYVYPESIPFLQEKPLPVPAGEAYGEGGSPSDFLLRSVVGAWPPRSENLIKYQRGLKQDIKYGKSIRKSGRKALRQAGVR